MRTQADGHIYGASTALQHWLFEVWFQLTILSGLSGVAPTPVLAVPFDEIRDPLNFYGTPTMHLELIERKGQVALWRIIDADVWAIQPNAGVFPGCGYYDVSFDTVVQGGPPTQYSHWGCDPVCAVLQDFLPSLTDNLMMLTVGCQRTSHDVEDYGWEYAVVVALAASGATLAAQWDAVLQYHMPSTAAWGIDAVTAIDTGNAYVNPQTDPLKGGMPL